MTFFLVLPIYRALQVQSNWETSGTFCWYVDNYYARFGNRNNATEFLNVLNSQDPQIQYTIEYESDHKELNFLDATIRNKLDYSYDFAKYCKPTITNVHIKLHSNICPNIAMGVKGFYHMRCTFVHKII